MEHSFISCNNKQRIIIIFLGWGMDATPFQHLHKPGYDIMILWDYTDFTPNKHITQIKDIISNYNEIVVVAWSFGVRIASEFLQRNIDALPITRSIAINGTESHIDDNFGIPKAIAQGTLSNLSEITVRKFRRRMFNSAKMFEQFVEYQPKRDFTGLKNELTTFVNMPNASNSHWDMALIGNNDAIFPPANQQNAWESTPHEVIPNMPHFPDMQHIIDKYIIDKELVALRFGKASSTYISNATPQQAVAEKLWQLSREHINSSKHLNIIEVGTGCGTLTSLYLDEIPDAKIKLWDIAPYPPCVNFRQGMTFECCDAETAIRTVSDNSIDVILSSSTLQWFNSPTCFIREIARVLDNGGVAALAFYASGTYSEIASVTGEELKYPVATQLCRVAQECGLEILLNDKNVITNTFQCVKDLIKHMKLTGVNAISGDSTLTAALRLLRNYPLNQDGTATLTYRPVCLILRKP